MGGEWQEEAYDWMKGEESNGKGMGGEWEEND